jgi:hypothetical protein
MSAYAIGRLLTCPAYKTANNALWTQLWHCLITLMAENTSNDVRLAAIITTKRIAKHQHKEIMASNELNHIVAAVLGNLRDRPTPVKLTAERALFYLLALQHNDDLLTVSNNN